MILEVAAITIDPAKANDFEKALSEAQKVLAKAEGYISHQFQRCIEDEGGYLLLIKWETLEAHTVGFRTSELFSQWRGLIGTFFKEAPTVFHYNMVSSS